MHVAFLLFDGFSNMVLSCLLEPLRAVRDQSAQDISWRVLTPDDQPVRSSSGLTIAPDMNCTDAGPLDILAVVAGYGFRDHALGSGPRRIAALARQARVLVGADAGAWLIAAAGLFDGRRRATLHWSLLADFAETFPHVPVASDRHIKEGRIWTCGGAASALDLTLAIIRERFGPGHAFTASAMFLHDAGPQDSPQGPLPLPGSTRLRQVVTLMASTIEHPLPLDQVAAQAGISLRKLDRIFRDELGLAPGRYYQMLRLSHARELAAATDFDLREIALRSGYADASSLSKAFRRAYGKPVRQAMRRK